MFFYYLVLVFLLLQKSQLFKFKLSKFIAAPYGWISLLKCDKE